MQRHLNHFVGLTIVVCLGAAVWMLSTTDSASAPETDRSEQLAEERPREADLTRRSPLQERASTTSDQAGDDDVVEPGSPDPSVQTDHPLRGVAVRQELTRANARLAEASERLRKMETDPEDLQSLYKEALERVEIARQEAVLQAVKKGDFVLLDSTTRVPLAVPEIFTLVGSEVSHDGSSARTYYTLRDADYPRFAAAREYADSIARRVTQARIDQWNKLPYETRKQQIEAKRAMPDFRRQEDYDAYLEKHFPDGMPPGRKVKPNSYTLIGPLDQ